MSYDRNAIDEFTVSEGCFGFPDMSNPYQMSLLGGEALRKDRGPMYPYYADYRILKTREQFEKICDFIKQYFEEFSSKNDGFDVSQFCFIGVPDGATRVGVLASDRIGNGHYIQARKLEEEAATFQADHYFLGRIEQGEKVIPIEDAIITGSNLRTWIRRIREAGGVVEHVLVFCDRREMPPEIEGIRSGDGSARDYVAKKERVNVHALTDIHSVLPLAAREKATFPERLLSVVHYYDQYGADRVYTHGHSRESLVDRSDFLSIMSRMSRGSLRSDLAEFLPDEEKRRLSRVG